MCNLNPSKLHIPCVSDVKITATEKITQDVFGLNARSNPYRKSIEIQIVSTTIGITQAISELFVEDWKNSCALLSFGLKHEFCSLEYANIEWFDRTLLTQEIMDSLVRYFELLAPEVTVEVSTGGVWVPPYDPYI